VSAWHAQVLAALMIHFIQRAVAKAAPTGLRHMWRRLFWFWF
jgi:hypothetical protein